MTSDDADDGEKRRETDGSLGGPAVAGIARVQVHDGRARIRRADGAPAICSAVTGRCGDMVGVWMAPVTAHVMMTLDAAMISPYAFPLPM